MYSVIITTYECRGKGVQFTRECLESVFSQTYRPIQCVVSDHSRDTAIEEMVRGLDTMDIDFLYTRYTENYGNPCHNWNNGLNYAKGTFIQYMAMDNRLAYPDAVKDIIHHLETTGSKWVATACQIHPNGFYIPRWLGSDAILRTNTIGGPTAIVIRDTLKHIKLDPDFTWLLDLDWYYRLAKEAGPPSFFTQTFTYIDRHHPDQLTHQLTGPEKAAEETAILARHL
jgi:glycosyltransferase involved in cell wall biosynthesis